MISFISNTVLLNIRDMTTPVQVMLKGFQPYSLTSYHYFRDFDFDKQLPKLFPLGAPKLFADSGAFSAATQGAQIDIDDYARWLTKHKKHFLTYANFDVIGNEKQTAKNQEYLENAYDLTPLPVFHVGADFKILDKLMKDYDYIALGGLVPFATDRKNLMSYFITCFKMAQTTGCKFHGFGMTNWKLLKSFPWHSVDSSSWNAGAIYGRLVFFDGKGEFMKATLWDKASVYKHGKRFRALGLDPEWFVDKEKYKRVYACLVDGVAWAQASLWLTQYWQQDIKVYFSNAENISDVATLTAFILGENYGLEHKVDG